MKWRKDYSHLRSPKIYTTTAKENNFYLPRQIIFLILAIIALVLLIWWLFFSNYFKVKEITISGSLNPEVQAEIEKLRGKNIFKLVLGNTEKELAQKQSSINTIEILRGIPNTLKIKVNVRKPILAWKSVDKSYFVDEKGIAFELGEAEAGVKEGRKIPLVIDSKNVPVELGRQIVTEDFVDFIKIITDNFKEKTGGEVKEFEIGETTLQVDVKTESGWKAIIDTTRGAEIQLEALKKVLENYGGEIHDYVDLRVEGKAYFK